MRRILLLSIIVLCCSCSIKYNKIYPNLVEYEKIDSTESVVLKYSTDILEKSSNSFIERKVKNVGCNIVSVSITNNTDRTLSFNENLFLRSKDVPVFIVDQPTLVKHVKRDLWWYSIWMGIGTSVQYYDEDKLTKNLSIPVSALVSFGTIYYAHEINEQIENDFLTYSLFDKKILPGETVYGLVGLKIIGDAPLHLEISEE